MPLLAEGKTEVQEAYELALGRRASEGQSWNLKCNRLIPKTQPLALLGHCLCSQAFLGDLFTCLFDKYLLSTCCAHDTLLVHKGDTEDIGDTSRP